jgi:type II secretory ATPase GspE/PulE/Tfp pilus assembly ATPase PilB-like protein
MNEQSPDDMLEKYAQAAKVKVLSSQADLDPKDRPLDEVIDWCHQRGNIIAMKSGVILTSDPTSRDVQNLKTMMINHGLKPGRVTAATQTLITVLLANVASEEELEEQEFAEKAEISNQQRRLRIIIQEAVDAHVSDVHVEVRTDVAKIRFRKFGEMYLHAEWFPRLGRELASVAFNKETDHATAHFNPLVPQDAAMPLDVGGQKVRLRLASAPAHGGFDIVMRILSVGDDTAIVGLDELGYTPEQIYLIKRAVQMPHGAVLLSGPTGSGKTTTLASCMQMVKSTKKVYTIEDPVEKVVPTVTQVPVNTEKSDRSFASFGRAALRMDPDYIVLGEMRDEDTAKIMVRAAITGHLVFSTVHTNSAPGIITRLADMGVSRQMLSDSNLLVCLIFQRLIPKLCEECALPIAKAPQHQEHLERWQAVFKEDYPNIRGRGHDCTTCHGVGVSGRTVVAEVVWVDEPGREFIHKGDILGWERYLRQQGWQTYKDRTLELVRTGKCDPFDGESLIGEINVNMDVVGFDYNQAREHMQEEMRRLAAKKQQSPSGEAKE